MSEFEGSGTGLASCNRIVARHSGQTTAHSQPEIGSDFVVTLPATRIAKGGKSFMKVIGKPIIILLAEDDLRGTWRMTFLTVFG